MIDLLLLFTVLFLTSLFFLPEGPSLKQRLIFASVIGIIVGVWFL